MVSDALIAQIAMVHAAAASSGGQVDRLRSAVTQLAHTAGMSGETELESAATRVVTAPPALFESVLADLRRDMNRFLVTHRHDGSLVLIIGGTAETQATRDRLVREGRRIELVETSEQALPRLPSAALAVVFTNAQGPGWSLISLVRNDDATSHIPIIAASDHTDPSDRTRLLAAGADAYVAAADVDRISDLVAALLAQSAHAIHRPPRLSATARVLICDDDLPTIGLATRVLAARDIEVLAQRDPRLIVATIAQKRPNALILEARLPGRSGLEILLELQRHPVRRQMPVLMTSGDDSSETIKAALASGASDYLLKPYGPADLRSRVERLLTGPITAARRTVSV